MTEILDPPDAADGQTDRPASGRGGTDSAENVFEEAAVPTHSAIGAGGSGAGNVFEGAVVPEASGPGRVGRVFRVAALAVGAVSMSALTYAVWGTLRGGGSGADGPEAVVEAMAAAASNEDAVAMISLMAPAEVGSFTELYPDVLDWAAREGHIADEQWLAGVDIEISGLDAEATHLHPDVAIVELRAGQLSVTVDPEVADPGHLDRFGSGFSRSVDGLLAELQNAVREGNEAVADVSLDGLFELREPDSLHVMTIRHEGRWYVSPFYTVAEYARRIADLPQADFTASREDAKPGAASASGVIAGLVEMLNSHRLEDYLAAETVDDLGGARSALNAFVPPDELGVWLDYAVTYQGWLDRLNEGAEPLNLEQAVGSLGLEISGEIDAEVNTRERPGPGGAVVVYLSSGSIHAAAEVTAVAAGEVQPWEIQLSWDGLCTTGHMRIYEEFDEFEECIDSEDWPGDDDEVFIVVREIDGYWYASYIETALAYARLLLDDYLASTEV